MSVLLLCVLLSDSFLTSVVFFAKCKCLDFFKSTCLNVIFFKAKWEAISRTKGNSIKLNETAPRHAEGKRSRLGSRTKTEKVALGRPCGKKNGHAVVIPHASVDPGEPRGAASRQTCGALGG